MADAPLTPLSEKDAPKTFLERGAAVPFTTPALMWARARQRGTIKELLVPGLANTRGIYVFEWAGLPQRFTLTLHDRLLHRAIASEADPSPGVVSRVAQKIALGGAAGADVQAAAERRNRQQAELELLVRLTLTMRIIALMSGDGSSVTPSELRTPAGIARAKALLAAIAGRLGIAPRALDERIEMLSVLAAATGMSGIPVKAPARRLLQALGQTTRVLREWADGAKGDSMIEARLIADVSEATCHLAEPSIATIDDNLQDIDSLLGEWSSGEKRMAGAATRLHWLLDGWDRLVNMWLDAANKGASEQSKTLAMMSYLLPMVPVRELPSEEVTKWDGFSKTLYYQARNSETPPTGLIDFEMMLRLEGHRVREAS